MASTGSTLRRLDAIVAVAGLGAFLACAAVAADGTVGAVEARAFRAVNRLPGWLAPPMQAAQLLGVLAVGPAVAVVAAMVRRWRWAVAALVVTAGKLLAERGVWELVQRSRPGTTIPDAVVRGDTPTAGASFVSGHVMLTTALAWVSTPYLRGRWRAVPWAIVALVAFARVYLGAHAPLDVAGGVAVGAALGGAVSLLLGVPDPGRGRSSGRDYPP